MNPSDEMACQELVELVTDYLDDALPPADRDRFGAHLAECDGCTTYLEQIRLTVAATSRLTPQALPPGVLDRLLDAYRRYRAP
jgi:anti-sigma factor RsiW